MSTLQADLRSAIAARDKISARLDDLRARARGLEIDRRSAEREADAAAERCRDMLGAAAAGEAVDVDTARAHRDASADRVTELVESAEGLAARMALVASELDGAQRTAAGARKRVAMALATDRESALRQAARAFARALQAFHAVAASAHRDHFAETSQLGNPIPHEGRAALLVSNSDGGIPQIFAEHGVSETLKVTARPLSEQELLSAAESLTDPDSTNGKAPTAQENHAHV